MKPTLIRRCALHSGWFDVLGLTLRLEDGTEVEREVAVQRRAVAVLPFDAERRTAMLVRLPRAPLFLADGDPYLLEAPAGVMDEADPEATARREAMEEVGLQLGEMSHVGHVWSSPGNSTETIDLYLAPYRQSDRLAAGGGVAGENENITVVEMPLAELWSMVEGCKLADMKTLTLVLALRVRQPELFATR